VSSVVRMEAHALLVIVPMIVNMVWSHAMQDCKLYWFVFTLHIVCLVVS
jgi:hypothetical protein